MNEKILWCVKDKRLTNHIYEPMSHTYKCAKCGSFVNAEDIIEAEI